MADVPPLETSLLPLVGVRILDLTRGLAPGYGSMILADLGAEVIKVEPPAPVRGRQGVPANVGTGLWAYELNRNKLRCTINLKHSKGIELLRRLVAISDLLLNGNTPRVMEQFGLEYDALKAVNPDIIMVNEPGFGSWGPYRDFVAVGGLLDALSGMASINGYEGGRPIKPAGAFPDPTSGINLAVAMLMALYARMAHGTGQRVDAPMVGAMLPLTGEAMMDEILNRATAEPHGNDRYPCAPHGAYPCKGEDRWVAISVRNDADWHALCDAFGRPDLLADPLYATQDLRWQHRHNLDATIAAVTRGLEAAEVMDRLQARGVEAAVVRHGGEVLASRHLQERGFFQPVELADGPSPFTLLPWLLDGTRARVRAAPAEPGEHNGYVFKDLLGLSAVEMAELIQERAIAGTLPPPSKKAG